MYYCNSFPDAGMGNVVAAPKPTRIQRLKRLIRILDRHRSTLGRRVGRVSRELAVTENKLKACLSRKSARDAMMPDTHLTQDSSVQVFTHKDGQYSPARHRRRH
jgi:hypothetical protein